MSVLKEFWHAPQVRKAARYLRRSLNPRPKATPTWRHDLDRSVLASDINTPEAERLSGIHHKIAQLEALGSVTVVGGLTTGGTDDVFRDVWPEGLDKLDTVMDSVPDQGFLLLYVPHSFWIRAYGDQYGWLPSWAELFHLFDRRRDWSIFQYSPSFDATGRYFFVAQKRSTRSGLPPESWLARQTFRVFFHPGGADLSQGNSSRALSAHLCHALVGAGATVFSYGLADLSAASQADSDDILIGHVGPWVRIAYERGLRRIVLFGPANRWYETRNLPDIEANATMSEQVAMSRMFIAQSGAVWRLTADYPDPEKWRWIDLGVDPVVFPRLRTTFSPMGRRKFCFIHLYDDHQKGKDLAEGIIRARPHYQFYWIGGQPISARNVRYFPGRTNTSQSFRRIVGQCDFVLTPSREDAQPGTVIELAALGLLPVVSYTSGYSLSCPRLAEPNTLDEWLEIVDLLQQASEDDLVCYQAVKDCYLERFHDWFVVESQIQFYLREFLHREKGYLVESHTQNEA